MENKDFEFIVQELQGVTGYEFMIDIFDSYHITLYFLHWGFLKINFAKCMSSIDIENPKERIIEKYREYVKEMKGKDNLILMKNKNVICYDNTCVWHRILNAKYKSNEYSDVDQEWKEYKDYCGCEIITLDKDHVCINFEKRIIKE